MSLSQYFRIANVMARMALRADATKFWLGYIWWVLEPFLFVGIFYFVFAFILPNRQPDFLVFLMTGKLAFIWFSKSISLASNSIISGKGLISKIDMPKTIFPFSAVQEGLYKQITVFILLFCILIAYGYPVTMNWLYIIPLVIVNYLLILACAYVGATLVCMLRDFAPLIQLGMLFLMFTSGVFWNVRELGSPEKSELLLAINPLAFVLDGYRQILMYNTPPDMWHLLAIAAGSGALLCMMVLIMRRTSKYLALKALSA